MSQACPTLEQLSDALRGGPSAREAELADHLANCPACLTRLEEMAGGSGWLQARRRTHPGTPPPTPAPLEQAMQSLEARPPEPKAGPAAAPLDFLKPSDQVGVLGCFGPYEVLEQVASGGMGIVLKARDPSLNRVVAIKVLLPTLAAQSLARARFVREARAAAAVVHDNVVPIYAVDECGGLPYLVMQFVKGRSLSERIRQTGALRLEEILRIGAQTAAGLAAAHAQGLIHRDVKPGNILLENGVERVKITDFGLARAADDSSLTHEGHIAGTPEYMSPEQARGEPADQRSDLFSFGCVLYEMATGISPFHAERPVAALRRVCDEEPQAAHQVNRSLPEWLGCLIQRLMAKDPAARPASASDVAEELAECLAEVQQGPHPNRFAPGPPPQPAPERRPLKLPVWLLALAVPALLALVFLRSREPSTSRPANPPPLPAPMDSKAASAHTATAPFILLPPDDGGDERGFPSLAEAVDAAPWGAVIECQFNGLQSIESIRRIEKALILRAAPGFEPVLMPANSGDSILFTHAPLVLEGLTLVTGAPRIAARAGPPSGTALSVENAAFLAAHCRFQISGADSPADGRHGHSCRLLNVPLARLLNCEIISRTDFGLHWNWLPASGAAQTGSQLLMQGCIVEGNLMSTLDRMPEALSLDLHQNTFVGGTLFLRIGSDLTLPLQVRAGKNVFALDTLVHRARRDRGESTLPRLLRWSGESNVYSVASYALTTPPVNRHEEWLANGAVTETNSLSAELGIKARLTNLTDRTPATEAAAFALTPEERQRLASLGWTHPARPGADPQKTGPGQSYHAWRNSPDYAEWQKLVREHVRPSAPGK